jgi:hypothetical protein
MENDIDRLTQFISDVKPLRGVRREHYSDDVWAACSRRAAEAVAIDLAACDPRDELSVHRTLKKAVRARQQFLVEAGV